MLYDSRSETLSLPQVQLSRLDEVLEQSLGIHELQPRSLTPVKVEIPGEAPAEGHGQQN